MKRVSTLQISVLIYLIAMPVQSERLTFATVSPPSENFDLTGWVLNVPADLNGDETSDQISEIKLTTGYILKDRFFSAPDGGMVFRTYVSDPRTSKRTKYTRTNLREMLRRGDINIKAQNKTGLPTKNTWVLSTAPESAKRAAGGIDGELYVKLAINHVTTTGHRSKIGKMTIAQIHARKNEPIVLFYRKLLNNKRGSVYAVHEEANGNDHLFEIIGNSSSLAEDPEDGIALNEKFSFQITVKGNEIKVEISREEKILNAISIDIKDSGYAVEEDEMYFTAGVVNKNNTGDDNDYVQATIYELETKHF